ncbi:MAG TPA: M20/M25/M40 family metallo-hydrolase [Oscillatoriaceae cyanobacterium]
MQPLEQINPQQLVEQAERWRSEIVAFTQELIRTPSLTGQEGALAELLASKMRELGYDQVVIDELGNCVGRIRGAQTGPSVLFSVHLDSAEAGDRSQWQFDPYGAELQDGFLHGRGASDHKAALAAMVYAGALLKRLGVPLAGDFVLGATVLHHQRASLGMRFLADRTLPGLGVHCDLAVLGNPTNTEVYLGHRGRVELNVSTVGRTCYAGAPWLGSNAIYKMMPVLQGIQELSTALPSHPYLERSTLAVTAMHTLPDSTELIPDRCTLTLDRRFLPSESVDEATWQVQSILNRLSAQDPEFKGEVHVRQSAVTAYTGLSQSAPQLLHPFITDSSHALVQQALGALQAVGQEPRLGRWLFATDGGYLSTVKNLTTLGYAPGDERFAQTPFDRVAVEKLIQSVSGYAAIAQNVAGPSA